MAYNEQFADRILGVLKDKNVKFEEKRMFGGIAYMVDEKMCVGIAKENLMLRVDPEIYEDLLQKDGCRPMDFTKRPMKGFVYVDPTAVDMEEDLANWIQYALDYNPKAKKSKKNKSMLPIYRLNS